MADFELDVDIDPRLVEKVVQDLEDEMERQVRLLAQGLRVLAESGMAIVKQDWVPVRTGYLRSTGEVADETVEPGFEKVSVVAGFSAHYARAVHETHPTRAKYLETPFMQLARTAEQRLSNYMRSQNA